MRIPVVATVMVLTVPVALQWSCGGYRPIEYSLSDAGVCRTATFPEWQFPSEPVDRGRFVFRHAAGDRDSVVLVAADASANTGGTSANKYRLDLDVPGNVTAVTDTQWAAATPIKLKLSHRARNPDEPQYPSGSWYPQPGDDRVLYRGHTFLRRGKYWAGFGGTCDVAVSLDGSWILLQSYEGPMPSGKGLWSGGEPRTGPFYLDVFNASSGAAIFRVTGEVNGADMPYAYGDNGWIAGRYLILQFDLFRHSFLVCDPAKASSPQSK